MGGRPTEERLRSILDACERGEPLRAIAERHGMSVQTVTRYRRVREQLGYETAVGTLSARAADPSAPGSREHQEMIARAEAFWAAHLAEDAFG